jgi:hypothetical protein
MEHYYATTIAEAVRALMTGILAGAIIATIGFIVISKYNERR